LEIDSKTGDFEMAAGPRSTGGRAAAAAAAAGRGAAGTRAAAGQRLVVERGMRRRQLVRARFEEVSALLTLKTGQQRVCG
jgi:hypothetical protein